ncbi:MAG TPA: hypothetical protein VF618_07825 [Thermoanaerobaculia bacterium]
MSTITNDAVRQNLDTSSTGALKDVTFQRWLGFESVASEALSVVRFPWSVLRSAEEIAGRSTENGQRTTDHEKDTDPAQNTTKAARRK